jgi:hypothetical protein
MATEVRPKDKRLATARALLTELLPYRPGRDRYAERRAAYKKLALAPVIDEAAHGRHITTEAARLRHSARFKL